MQTDARRFFCCLFLSHSALVFVGLETLTEIGLTGALCIWLSVGLSLTGFGLTLRAIESRRGRVMLDQFQGLYDHAPGLAIGYLLTGLACVGFPGTVGFVGTELLVDGVVEQQPISGIAVVLAVVVPLLGWAYSSALGYPLVWFGVLPLPDWVPVDRELARAIKRARHLALLPYTGEVLR